MLLGLGEGLLRPNAFGVSSEAVAAAEPSGRGVADERSFPAAFAALTEASAFRLGRVRGRTGFSLAEGAESLFLPSELGMPMERESEPLLLERDEEALPSRSAAAAAAWWNRCISWVGVLPSEGAPAGVDALLPSSILPGRDAMVDGCVGGNASQQTEGGTENRGSRVPCIESSAVSESLYALQSVPNSHLDWRERERDGCERFARISLVEESDGE